MIALMSRSAIGSDCANRRTEHAGLHVCRLSEQGFELAVEFCARPLRQGQLLPFEFRQHARLRQTVNTAIRYRHLKRVPAAAFGTVCALAVSENLRTRFH